MNFSTRLFAVVGILAASALPACADTFSYDFNDPTFFLSSFTYTSPVLISTPTSVVPTTCSVAGLACSTVDFDPANLYLEINAGNLIAAYSGLDLFSVGVHNIDGITMAVTDNPSPLPIPEPSSIALFGTGVLGALGVFRRKIFQS